MDYFFHQIEGIVLNKRLYLYINVSPNIEMLKKIIKKKKVSRV